jgi:hypothetical protein
MVSKVIADQASSGGSGGHAGTFSLAKTGGMPMLSGTNKYSGSLRSTPGTLAVGTDTSTRFSGTISGTSALTKIGSGTLVLSGANTHPAAPAFVPARSACQNQALGTGALTPTGSLVDYANGLPIRSWSTARPLSAGDHRNR